MVQGRLSRVAVVVSVLVHLTGFAVLAAWTTRAASSSLKLAGQEQVIQLTARMQEPRWTAEPLALAPARPEASVLIEPREARIGKRRFVHVPTARVPMPDVQLSREQTLTLQKRARDDEVPKVAGQRTARAHTAEHRRPAPRVSETASVPPPSLNLAGTDDRPPDLSRNAPPTYPALALQRRWEGTVLLRIWVDATGRVTRVEVFRSSGHRILDGAAATAVRQWTATPAYRNGEPVATVEVLPVRFKL